MSCDLSISRLVFILECDKTITYIKISDIVTTRVRTAVANSTVKCDDNGTAEI